MVTLSGDWYRTSDGKPEIVKDPDAILDYNLDFGPWLSSVTDTIASAAISIANSATMALANDVDDPSIPAAGYEITDSSTRVVIWLKGGAVRDRAAVSCLITTAGGRTEERTAYVRVLER